MGNTCGADPLSGKSLVDDLPDVKRLVIHRAKARRFTFDGVSDKHCLDGLFNGPSVDALADGELLILLESVLHVPYQLPNGCIDCGAPGDRSYGRPHVRAWVEEDGARIGNEASWPAKKSNRAPVWYSAKPLGVSMANCKHAVLHMEVWDKDLLVGSLKTPLDGLPLHFVVRRELDAKVARGGQQAIVNFRALQSKNLMASRSVFFVRHGESVWNDAQSKMKLHTMAGTTDHPLTKAGRDQATGLCHKLKAMRDKLSEMRDAGEGDSAAGMLSPDAVYVSPLTRAVQTAVIGLGPVLTAQGPVEMVLMAAAREKQNFGGLDSQSTKLGSEIIQNTLDQTLDLYTEKSIDALQVVMNAFRKLRFDVEEVADNWWCETPAESRPQLEVRLHEFMCQLAFSPHRTIVVVGHSHFFREVLKKYMTEDFKASDEKLTRSLSEGKLMNCGAVRVDLDPAKFAKGSECITMAELVLGTVVVKDEGKLKKMCSCTCGAPDGAALAEGELNLDGDAGSSSMGVERHEPLLPSADLREGETATKT